MKIKPAGALAFVTLRQALTPQEVKEIKKIVKAGMKQWKAERPLNPVGGELANLA